MPHDLPIILGAKNCVQTNYPELAEQAQELYDACKTLDGIYATFDKEQSNAAHAAIHNAQLLLIAICNSAPHESTLEECITEVNSYL